MLKRIDRFLIVPYESINENPELFVRKICSHIQIPFKEDYLNVMKNNVGNNARKIVNINPEQIKEVMPLFTNYVSELEKRLDFQFDANKVINKYTSNINNYENFSSKQSFKPKIGHHALFYIHKIISERKSRDNKKK